MLGMATAERSAPLLYVRPICEKIHNLKIDSIFIKLNSFPHALNIILFLS